MFSAKLKLVGLLMLVMTTVSFAQQVRRLTLEEAIDLGMTNSKQLKISQSKIGVSNTKYKQEIALLAPNAYVSSSFTYNSPNIAVQSFQLDPTKPAQILSATLHDYYLNQGSISQVIFAGMRGWNTLHAYKDQIKMSQYDLAKDKLEVRNNIILAYYNHYKLLESKKVVDENLRVLQQRLKDAQNFQTVGMALKNDVLKVQLSISSLQQSADDVQSAIDVSNFNLNIYLGLPDTTKIEIVDAGLITTKPEFDIHSGVKNALIKRPEIKSSMTLLDMNNTMLRISKGLYFPVVKAGFNFYYSNPNQRVFIEPQAGFHESWDIGVGLNWNLTNLFTTRYQSSEAKLNIQQAEQQHDQITDNIKMEVNANYAAFKLAIEKITLNETAIEQAKENRRLTKDQYDNGIKNITDMLDADNLVTTSEINLLNAKIDAEIAYAKLLKSTAN